jgi:phosphatidylserine/phosphatidylglycerophosphate/cardiolipin synthase-like enzyme
VYDTVVRALLILTLAAACTHDAAPADVPVDAELPALEDPSCGALVPRQVDVEVFVGPTGLQERISAFIDGAERTLDIAMYLFDVDAIADRVIAAGQRGVAVRVLLDPDHEGNDRVRARLTAGGITHRDAPTIFSFSHQKYLVADGSRALIMSANLSTSAMDDERNYGVVDSDPADLRDLRAVFDQDWATGAAEPATPADLSCTRLVVSPSNARPRILQLIDGATATLDVEAMYVSERGVEEAILAAQRRGVAVRVILPRGSDTAETKTLFGAAGIAVRNLTGLFCHAKLVIADGVAFIGSENYSLTSLTRNREVGVFVAAPASRVAVEQFELDFATGVP